jgi:hypothetical protein
MGYKKKRVPAEGHDQTAVNKMTQIVSRFGDVF